jgi:protein-S-isoprenylcysteine O-methyltransferase Ste14
MSSSGSETVLPTYLALAILLSVSALLVFRVVVRNDYRRHRRLTLGSSVLESIYWGPAFAFPYLYNPPSWPAFWELDAGIDPWMQVAGSGLIVLGIVSVSAGMGYLGFRKSLGREVDVLRVTGLYGISRNPQVVCGLLIILGIALRWPSWYSLGWVGLMWLALHLMVITEEEHLRSVFGSEYVAYCERVPRYFRLGAGRRKADASQRPP